MSIILGANSSTISCNGDPCWASLQLVGVTDPVKAREMAASQLWITVKPPSGPAVDYCPQHSFGPKSGPSSSARIFRPPAEGM